MLLIIGKILIILICLVLAIALIALVIASSLIKSLLSGIEYSCHELQDRLVFKEKSTVLKIFLPWLGLMIIGIFDKFLILKGRSVFIRLIDRFLNISAIALLFAELAAKISKLRKTIKSK